MRSIEPATQDRTAPATADGSRQGATPIDNRSASAITASWSVDL
jgi:hypothetical protein